MFFKASPVFFSVSNLREKSKYSIPNYVHNFLPINEAQEEKKFSKLAFNT